LQEAAKKLELRQGSIDKQQKRIDVLVETHQQQLKKTEELQFKLDKVDGGYYQLLLIKWLKVGKRT